MIFFLRGEGGLNPLPPPPLESATGQLQRVQCVTQKREAVYLTKYYPVTATWYPIRFPTGHYIYLFTMYCVPYDHATMSNIS